MYRPAADQLSLFEYDRAFDGLLSPQNRWVRLAKALDWPALEQAYAQNFGRRGKKALPVRMALGLLIIQKVYRLSDRETVRLVAECPCLQYFVGRMGYASQPPCVPATLAKFRRRIPPQQVDEAVRLFRQIDRKDGETP